MTAVKLELFKLTVPGNPGEAAVNGWKTPILVGKRVRMVLSRKYRAWTSRASAAAEIVAAGASFDPGPLVAEVVAYWPRLTRTGEAEGLPFGDVDAVGKAALDALEAAGILVDGQVIELRLRKLYAKDSPRVTIEINRSTASRAADS